MIRGKTILPKITRYARNLLWRPLMLFDPTNRIESNRTSVRRLLKRANGYETLRIVIASKLALKASEGKLSKRHTLALADISDVLSYKTKAQIISETTPTSKKGFYSSLDIRFARRLLDRFSKGIFPKDSENTKQKILLDLQDINPGLAKALQENS